MHEGKKLHRKGKDVEIKKKRYQEIKKKKLQRKQPITSNGNNESRGKYAFRMSEERKKEEEN